MREVFACVEVFEEAGCCFEVGVWEGEGAFGGGGGGGYGGVEVGGF